MNDRPGNTMPEGVDETRTPGEQASGESDDKDEDDDNPWNQIGFHRPLGGFWYNYMLALGMAVLGVLFLFWLMPNYILPFPEAIGFQDIIRNLFAVYFMIADVGVGRAVQRFVADENIKNPLKALQYLQFFIWFQMFTGLAQVTIIAVWALEFVRVSNLAYATWFILAYSTIQYPGMLGVFEGALEGFQRFDKANLIMFFQGVVLENSTRIALILLGRWWGAQDPAIGELMGATIGSIIGAYVDDFVAAIIAARWTRPILQKIKPEWGIRDMFGVDFDLPLAKECMVFGFKAILPSTFHQANQFVQILLLITFLPNYAYIWGLFSIAEMISGVVGTFRFKISSTISEAFNNGKKSLVQNYTMRAYRWLMISTGFLLVLLLAGAPLLGAIAGAQFSMAAPMIQVLVVGRVAEGPGSVNADVFLGCDKPEYYIITNALEAVSRVAVLYVLLAHFHLGWLALALGRITGWWLRWFSGIYLLNRLFRFRVNWWQTFIAPVIAMVVEFAVLQSLIVFLHPVMMGAIGMIPSAMIILVLAIFPLPLFVYFPVYAFAGGWDDGSLSIFKRAMGMSGPSKPLVRIIYVLTAAIAKVSPLHGRFPITSKDAEQEIAELMGDRDASYQRAKEQR